MGILTLVSEVGCCPGFIASSPLVVTAVQLCSGSTLNPSSSLFLSSLFHREGNHLCLFSLAQAVHLTFILPHPPLSPTHNLRFSLTFHPPSHPHPVSPQMHGEGNRQRLFFAAFLTLPPSPLPPSLPLPSGAQGGQPPAPLLRGGPPPHHRRGAVLRHGQGPRRRRCGQPGETRPQAHCPHVHQAGW